MELLHHDQVFDVIIEKSDYDIKNVIMMRKAHGFLAPKIGHVGTEQGSYISYLRQQGSYVSTKMNGLFC